MPKRLTEQEINFRIGAALALSTMHGQHDCPTICADAMLDLDLTLAKIRPLGLSEWDMANLREIEKHRVCRQRAAVDRASRN